MAAVTYPYIQVSTVAENRETAARSARAAVAAEPFVACAAAYFAWLTRTVE